MVGVKSGNTEEFKQFSHFSSLEEINHHMEMGLLEHNHDLSIGELMGLKRLVRFAAKFGTILKSIHENIMITGISRSIFKRMVLKAKEFRIITVFETERKNFRSPATYINLIVFSPIFY